MVASRPSRSEEKSEPSSEFTGSLCGNFIYLWSIEKLGYVCRCVDEPTQNKYLCKRATSYIERPREKISALGNCGPATPPILRPQCQCSSSVKYNIFQLGTFEPQCHLTSWTLAPCSDNHPPPHTPPPCSKPPHDQGRLSCTWARQVQCSPSHST